MVWVLIYAGGIRKFYSFSEMSDFMGIAEEELSPYRNKDSFRINGYNIKKKKTKVCSEDLQVCGLSLWMLYEKENIGKFRSQF